MLRKDLISDVDTVCCKFKVSPLPKSVALIQPTVTLGGGVRTSSAPTASSIEGLLTVAVQVNTAPTAIPESEVISI